MASGTRPESRIPARVVSRGIAFGRAVCLYGRKRQYFRVEVPVDKVDAELTRLDSALELAAKQLEDLIASRKSNIPDAVSDILDVHLMFLRESGLFENCKQIVVSESVNAEWAVKLVSDEHLNRFRGMKDEHLREKAVDLEDVTERVLNALAGDDSVQYLPKNSIIIASEVRPSTMLEFLRNQPAGLVTEHGGWTSHVFIMAREMRIPALAGVKDVLRRVKTGDLLAIDAVDGELCIRPNDGTRNSLLGKLESNESLAALSNGVVGRVLTLDDVEVRIAANVDKPEGCRLAVEMGTNGVGLLRSEYLFEHINGLPSEEVQLAAYREVALAAGRGGVTIRTFDLGIEQTSVRVEIREKNPALGLRAIRLSLAQERQFRIQLRSILRASFASNVNFVLPLVSGVEEIRRTIDIVAEEKRGLTKNGIPFGEPGLGVMIELPSAVLTIDEILPHVDFICLGTNDLVQYLLGVDRDNESVADWYQTLHPAVIRSIRTVLGAAKAADKRAVVCGEMAGSPFYTPLLIGLGARDFSMNPHSIPAVHRLISGISHAETLQIVSTIESAETASEIVIFLLDYYREKWPHLFSPEILVENKDKQNKNISKN